ncbi:MAG: GNAT family N-acetyltransferase [Roseburia sp.]|nr:GNAT family N-acetyltransferase [Roseburia sp.]MDY5884631.1 GNAT family N-acetyltransferase [Roseburia sp.]
MNIRKATTTDLSRIAEIYIFNNRINYFPIFKDPSFSFGELQVVSLIDHYLKKKEILNQLYVFDDGLIKGFLQIQGTEICKLYVEPCFQSEGIGHELITYAIREFSADHLWALEKNTRAIAFYQRHGFCLTGEKEFEEGTTEYIIKLGR